VPQDELAYAGIQLSQSFGFLYQPGRALVRGVEIDLIAGCAADRGREDRQSPVKIAGATKSARCN
jgi:hypothetical protein